MNKNNKNLSKFEKYVLNHIGIERGRKWLLKIEALVHKYQNHRISLELEVKRDKFVKALPEEQRATANTLLNNQISSLLITTNLGGRPHSNEEIHLLFDSAVKTIGAYQLLSNIIGIQPLSGPVGMTYALQYANNESGLNLQFNSIACDAKTSKFKTCVSVEVLSDIKSVFGLDIKTELAKALGSEFGTEITSSVIRNLIKLASESTIECLPEEGISNSQLAYIELNKASVDIARTTRRGPGNFLIMSPTTFAEISMIPNLSWVPTITNTTLDSYGLTYAGKLGDRYSIYLSMDSVLSTGKILVGYAGVLLNKTFENKKTDINVDVGLIVAPYIPIVSAGVMTNPDTYSLELSFLNRSGIVYNTIEENTETESPQQAKKYYRLVDISKLLAH